MLVFGTNFKKEEKYDIKNCLAKMSLHDFAVFLTKYHSVQMSKLYEFHIFLCITLHLTYFKDSFLSYEKALKYTSKEFAFSAWDKYIM